MIDFQIYIRTTEDVINKGNSSSKAMMLQDGINTLKADNFESMNFKKATEYLKKMGRTEFFHFSSHYTMTKKHGIYLVMKDIVMTKEAI